MGKKGREANMLCPVQLKRAERGGKGHENELPKEAGRVARRVLCACGKSPGEARRTKLYQPVGMSDLCGLRQYGCWSR